MQTQSTQGQRVAARLRRVRAEEGGGERSPITQHEAALRVGTSEGQWRRWESGRHVPRPDALARIATEFGIPLGEFFTEPNGKATSEDRLAAVQSALEDVSEALRALQLSHQELANKLVRN